MLLLLLREVDGAMLGAEDEDALFDDGAADEELEATVDVAALLVELRVEDGADDVVDRGRRR